MLGRFLEFSFATPDIRASLDFYGRLGFSAAEVGDVWGHPYAVVTDGRICLGLHQDAIPTPALTFVKPDLFKYLANLEAIGIEFESRQLGNDVFNELTWCNPSGQRIHLVEARTFSPAKRANTDTSACGYFQEIALPTQDLDTAKSYWEQFGFVGMDEPDAWLPHVSCTSDTIDLGLYDSGHLRKPALLFAADDLKAQLARLAIIGIEPTGELPTRSGQVPTAILTAPEGTPLLITATSDR